MAACLLLLLAVPASCIHASAASTFVTPTAAATLLLL
jgi:hypothetical protein